MPWMFSSGGNTISSLLAFLGIFVAFLQAGWGMIAHRRITANTCLLVFCVGLCITYGNYDYLTAISKKVGASTQWSGLSSVPESFIEDGQYGKQIKRKGNMNTWYPPVAIINTIVHRFQARVAIVCLSLLGALTVVVNRRRRVATPISMNDLILGLPAIILGVGGLGCILILAI